MVLVLAHSGIHRLLLGWESEQDLAQVLHCLDHLPPHFQDLTGQCFPRCQVHFLLALESWAEPSASAGFALPVAAAVESSAGLLFVAAFAVTAAASADATAIA